MSGHKIHEGSFRVTGHELKVFLSVARLEDDDIHVTHDKETASKLAMKMDLPIMLSDLIKEQGFLS